ncbi:MAG: phosphotransferase family protein [bacterium]|nr:phosphotransferase family protein [bacterium]
MSDAPSVQLVQTRLAAFLRDAAGLDVTITGAQPLAGGASRDMWRIDAVIDGQPERLVLRRDLPTQMIDSALSREHEFALMTAAFAAGIRVARPRWLCADPSILGGAFFLMDYADGIAIGRKVVSLPDLADARRVLPAQLAEQLARIHALDVRPFGFLPAPPPGNSPAQAAVDQTWALLEGLNAVTPTFAFCLRWAAERAPSPARVTLIHGDFRIGNVMVDAAGLTAIADWEFAHLGDPAEELGYLCMRDWRFGVGHLRMGGISPREPFLQAYEAACGYSVDRAAVDWWEIFGNIRWAAVCLGQAARHLGGQDRSVELASLGRRSAEMQLEALNGIEKMGL